MSCNHQTTHSGRSRYDRAGGQLLLEVVCDRCGAPIREVGSIPYVPQPRRLYVHLVELAARELGLEKARVERLRLAALREEPLDEGVEGEVLSLCRVRLGRGGRPAAYSPDVMTAVERAWELHDRRLDRAAA